MCEVQISMFHTTYTMQGLPVDLSRPHEIHFKELMIKMEV